MNREVGGLRSVRLRAAAMAAGVGVLAAGCRLTADPDPLVGQVAELASANGATRIAAVTIGPDSDDTAVLLLLPGEARWVGAPGADLADQAGAGQPRGGLLPDRLPGEALHNQLASLVSRCNDHPQVRAFVSPSGSMIAESLCGVGDGRRVVSTSIDGLTQEGPGLDLTRKDGLSALIAEIHAAVPGEFVYEIAISGQASGATSVGVVQAGNWTLPDGTQCQVAYHRAAKPEAGKPLRWYTCDGVGPRAVPAGGQRTESQSEYEIAELSGPVIAESLAAGLAENGLSPEQVEFYGVMRLPSIGTVLTIQTSAGMHFHPY